MEKSDEGFYRSESHKRIVEQGLKAMSAMPPLSLTKFIEQRKQGGSMRGTPSPETIETKPDP